MQRHVYWSILLFLFGLSIFFRFFNLGVQPQSIYWDEAAILVDAKAIGQTGYDMHGNYWLQPIFPSYGDYKLPILIWLVALSVKIFDVTQFALRLPSALFGMLTVLLTIFLVRELSKYLFKGAYGRQKSQYLTLGAVLIAGTSFWSILFSRTAFEGYIAQAIVGISIFCGLKAQRRWWLYIISAALGLTAVYTYYSVRFVWPVVFIFAAVLPYTQQILQTNKILDSIKTNRKKIISWFALIFTAFGLFFIGLLPMFYSPHYAASQQYRLSATSILQREPEIIESNKLREMAGNTTIDRVFFHRNLLTLKVLASHYGEHLSPAFLFLSGDQNLRHGTQFHGLFALILCIPLLSGFYMLARHNKFVLLFLVVWWLISLLPASVPYDVPHALRSLNALLPISIIMTFGMYYVLSIHSKVQLLITSSFFLVLAIQLIQFWHYYSYIYPVTSAVSWQGGYGEVAKKIIAEKSNYLEVWVSVPDNKLYLWVILQPTFSAKEIQQFEKDSFEIQTIENIRFAQYDFHTIKNKQHSVLLVNKPDILENQFAELGITPQKVEYITDPTGTQKYMFASFISNQ
jgi:4-amino-4-deoxy-L-arabinose transferase-like glycosyltransferase